MAEKRVKLTKTSVAKVQPVAGKQLLLWDTELRGFGLRVSAGGAKSYIMQRRVGNVSRRITLGRADDIGAEAARRKALAAASQFAEGVDPVKEKARQKARGVTLREAFADYMQAPKKKGGGRGAPKKARTLADIESVQRKFADWLEMPVAEITGSMVKQRHAELVAKSAAQGNLAMRYLRAAINHVIADADDDDPIVKRNPVDRLNRLNQWAEVKRATGHIATDRLADWLEAVQTGLTGLKHENEMRDALLFILLTGARKGEVLGEASVGYAPLRWSDVDLGKGIVTFRDTKNRTDHELPLPTQLVAMLEARAKISGPDYVFSDWNGNVPNVLRSAVTRIEALTGIRAPAHDLRRTFATVASKLDISAYKLKRLTNHIGGGDVTAGYVQVSTDDLRDAMQRIEDFMLSPARTAAGNVVQLEARA